MGDDGRLFWSLIFFISRYVKWGVLGFNKIGIKVHNNFLMGV